MRLSTFGFLLLGVAALAATGWILWNATAQTRAWKELSAASGKDLEAMQSERIRLLTDSLSGESAGGFPVRWILRLQGPCSEERLLLCRPGAEGMFLSLFDDRLRRVGSGFVRTAQLTLGTLKAVRGNVRPDLEPWTFSIELEESADGASIEYYSFLPDGPALLRLERRTGESVPNPYLRGDPIGPPPVTRTPSEWERRLSSDRPGEVLAVLVWLGGIHSPTTEGSESFEQVATFSETSGRPGVRQRLRELSRSPHPWIAHAAEQARLRVEK